MNSFKLNFFVSLMFLSSLSSACSWYTNTYYVSSDGHVPTCADGCTEQSPCTFQSALQSSMDDNFDNTIYVKAGIYDLSTKGLEYNISKTNSLTIEGESATSVVLDGGGLSIPLVIRRSSSFDDSGVNIHVSKLTFKNGNTTGLAITLSSATLLLEHSFFISNGLSSGYGGAYITNDEGSLTIFKNVFRDNTAIEGGGLYIFNGSGMIDISKNEFTHNNSTSVYESDARGGGGFFVEGATSYILISHNIIAYNTAQNSGGGFLGVVISANGKLITTNNTIIYNNAHRGGGIYAHIGDDNSIAKFYNNIIWNDHADTQTNNGDAIYLHNTTNADCNISRNVWGDDTNSLYLYAPSNVVQSLNMRQHVRISNLFLLPDARRSIRLMHGSPGIGSGLRCLEGVAFSDYEDNAFPLTCININLGAVQTLSEPKLSAIYYLLFN